MYQIGQKVYSKYYGDGEVISTTCIRFGDTYPIAVRFSNEVIPFVITFTPTGIHDLDDQKSDKNLLHKILKPRKASNAN